MTRKQLNEHLRDTGLFFQSIPARTRQSAASATRASGTNAVRYGTMRENVLFAGSGAAGREIHPHRQAGAEVVRRLRSYPYVRRFRGHAWRHHRHHAPALRHTGMISSAICTYLTVDDAVNTVILTIQSVLIARIELIDKVQMQALNKFAGLGYAERPTLFFEFHGTEAGVAEQIESVKTISDDFGGADFVWASKAEDRSKLWQARHDAHYANMQLRPGAKAWPTDVCVPLSRLGECIAETRKDIEESGLLAPIVGHVGDGNFHVDMVLNPDDGDEGSAVALNERLVSRALSMDGTCTGEHGVGYGKIDKLVEEHGETAIDVMRGLKQSIDPPNLMNPGKIVRL